MKKITTTIKRQFFKEIVAKRKLIEYREIKDYWQKRFAGIETPFLLRLINGMSKTAPEVTLEVFNIVENRETGDFELHLGRILEIKNWDIEQECAKAD